MNNIVELGIFGNRYNVLRLLVQKISSEIKYNPVECSIRKKLTETFKPFHLEVINESYMHNVPKGSETHFKVVVVSDLFHGKTLLESHKMINGVLQPVLQDGVHALSIVSRTREQWEQSSKEVSQSPACRGGFGK